jgi:chromosome partitioning protein
MIVIGVCGRKGGSGKTTVSVHLAAELVTRGRSVVLVDCDIQGSAAHWAEPGNLPMAVEHRPLEADDQIKEWSAGIRAIKAEILVLDSPPHLNAALGGVIGLSDIAIVPCGPSGLDLMATGETVSLIREIRAVRGGRPSMLLVPNRIDHRTSAGRELSGLLKEMGEPVAPEIRYRTPFADSFNNGSWVGAFAPGSPSHREMRVLVDHILAQVEETKK